MKRERGDIKRKDIIFILNLDLLAKFQSPYIPTLEGDAIISNAGFIAAPKIMSGPNIMSGPVRSLDFLYFLSVFILSAGLNDLTLLAESIRSFLGAESCSQLN